MDKNCMILFQYLGDLLIDNKYYISMQEKNQSESTTPKFLCTCGKSYKSKPAVYTHIKNKHNGDKDHFRIIDPANGAVDNNRAIRLTQIKFNEIESSLMTLADLTYMQIARIIKKHKLIESQYLLDLDYVSDSQDYEAALKPKSLLESEIDKSGLRDIIKSSQEKNQGVLKPFKIQKFELSMQHELAKHFKTSFYVKISMQILLYFCKMNEQSSIIKSYQSKQWKPEQIKIREEIQRYCKQWISIRNRYSWSR